MCSELRFNLGNMKICADENPCMFSKLAPLEHAYAHTKYSLTNDDMIGPMLAIKLEKYRMILYLYVENQGDALELQSLAGSQDEDLGQGGGSKGMSTVTSTNKVTDAVMNAFTRFCYVCKDNYY